MINFVKNLTTSQVILINLGIIILNVLFVLLLKHLTIKKYEKTQSIEETLYFQLKLGKYVQSILMCVTSFSMAFTIFPKFKSFGHMGGFLLSMGTVLGVIVLISIIQQLLMYDLNTMLRKTTSSKGEQVKLLIRMLFFMFIPMIIFYIIIILVDDNLHVSKAVENIIKPIIIVVVILIFSLVMPFLTKYIIKAIPMEESKLKEELKDFLNNAGLPKTNLYLWPTKKNKVANALVSGLITKNIFISDYLLENFDIEETKSVLAHEIGHIKKHHLWIRTLLFLGIIIIFPSIGATFDWYEANYHKIPIWFGISILAIVFILYMGFFTYFIIRVQEKQADEYVLNLEIQANVYIKALYKLTKLNNMVMKFGKMDEKFQTHPSTAKRIKWIMEKSQTTDEVLEEIKNSVIL